MQNILFISNIKPDKYPIIDKHYEWVSIHTNLSFEEFSEIYHDKKPYAIYTYGDVNIWKYLPDIFNIRKIWIHLNTFPDNLDIISCVFSGIIEHQYDIDHPLLSVITTTYNSKEKIQRPWKTLRNQTYTNWEWIVWDDSEDNKTYENLLEMQKKDLRMRVYKAPKHSGIIGEMKRLASGVAYGSFIIELDHDDEIHPELFQWVVDASKFYKEANFFYTDSAQLYERTLKTHSYGDFFGYGYGSHANVWSEMHNQWVISTVCAPPNAITLRHLIGMPNHIRVWKTELYDKIGKHNPRLSVSDDYELLVKSYIYGKWCHIRACGYYQYRNEDGNFTFIRNSLIQHNIKHIYNHYKSQLPQPVKNFKIEPVWKFDNDIYPTTHLTYDPHPHENSIIVIDPTIKKLEKIFNNYNSVHVYIIGKCPNIKDEWKLKISWWDLGSNDISDKIRYAKKFLVTGSNLIINNDVYPLTLLDIVNNSLTDKNTLHSYLELYESLFSAKKESAKNILEIGIGDVKQKNGGSIKLWYEYFVNATIYSLDILSIDRVIDELKNNPRIILYTSIDAYDDDFFNNYILSKNIKYDILLDDGPHTLESMKKFINLYSQLMTDDGILVIEDVQSIEWTELLKNEVPEHLKQYIQIYDLRSIKNRYDDIVFVINKNNS
jgi:glycosyltransferase involved in cell wall biosynthesis